MPQKRDSLTRRGFGRRAALAGVAGALGTGTAGAQDRGGQPPLPQPDQTEVDAKFEHMVRKYGERLNEEQKTRARTVLARHQRMLMRVREFPLDIADAPATELRLYPKGLKD
jgi:hypothetical protein